MITKSTEELRKIIDTCKHINSEMLESESVEFKEYSGLNSLHGSKDLAEEISAIANRDGGVVLVGIRDGNNVQNNNWASQLVGFQVGDTIEIEQRLKGKLKPNLDIKVGYVEFEGKHYLAIHIPTRRDTLIATASGKVYIRDGRSSRPMTPDEIRSAVTGLQNYDWTAEILDSLDISVLNKKSVSDAWVDYCQRKEYPKENWIDENAFLEAIGATSNGKLTKSGLLFLGKNEEIRKWLGVFEYRFTWRARSGYLFKNDVWDDNLWETISRAKSHFNECNREEKIEFKGKEYACKTLDDVAFHEGYLNAIVHRDYSIEGMVVVDFDSNKMIITNPGVFYGGVSADNISIHQPRHRNKALAKLLMNFQLVDRAGMGVKRMGFGSLVYGRQFPVFRESFDTVEVVMFAETVLPGIFVLTRSDPAAFGVIDLIIFNSLYRVGAILVTELNKRIKGMVIDVWPTIKDSVKRHPQIELCGTNDGVYVRVVPKWNDFFDVRKTLKTSVTSSKHVSVFDYVMEFKEASNEEITKLLSHKNSAHTSKFLREATYVKRAGSGPGARWSLKDSLV